MSILLIALHVIVCITLIMIVLLQTGKGADMGAAFGGGSSQTLFGSTGASTFLGKATTVAAVIFMLTSLTLAYISSHRTEGSVMQDVQQSPAATEKAPAETQESPSGADQPAEGESSPTAETDATGSAGSSTPPPETQ